MFALFILANVTQSWFEGAFTSGHIHHSLDFPASLFITVALIAVLLGIFFKRERLLPQILLWFTYNSIQVLAVQKLLLFTLSLELTLVTTFLFGLGFWSGQQLRRWKDSEQSE